MEPATLHVLVFLCLLFLLLIGLLEIGLLNIHFISNYVYVGIHELSASAIGRVKSPGVGVTGSCELPNLSARSYSWVL